MKDMFGQDILPGDIVLRPGTADRTGILGWAYVIDDEGRSITIWYAFRNHKETATRFSTKKGQLNRPERCYKTNGAAVPLEIQRRLQAAKAQHGITHDQS